MGMGLKYVKAVSPIIPSNCGNLQQSVWPCLVSRIRPGGTWWTSLECQWHQSHLRTFNHCIIIAFITFLIGRIINTAFTSKIVNRLLVSDKQHTAFLADHRRGSRSTVWGYTYTHCNCVPPLRDMFDIRHDVTLLIAYGIVVPSCCHVKHTKRVTAVSQHFQSPTLPQHPRKNSSGNENQIGYRGPLFQSRSQTIELFARKSW